MAAAVIVLTSFQTESAATISHQHTVYQHFSPINSLHRFYTLKRIRIAAVFVNRYIWLAIERTINQNSNEYVVYYRPNNSRFRLKNSLLRFSTILL